MAKVTRISDHKSIEARRIEWLNNYPDKFLACRGGHAFPRPVPGRKMSRTKLMPFTDVDRPARDGYRYVEQSCANCGRIRWKITGPRGSYYADSTRWHYNDPKGYATPHGLGLTYADYAELYWTRMIEGDQYFLAAVDESEEEKANK